MAVGLRLVRAIGASAALQGRRDEGCAAGPGVKDADDESARLSAPESADLFAPGSAPAAWGMTGWRWSASTCGCAGLTGSGWPSVMQSIVSANTNATVCAIAERAADLILA